MQVPGIAGREVNTVEVMNYDFKVIGRSFVPVFTSLLSPEVLESANFTGTVHGVVGADDAPEMLELCSALGGQVTVTL